jgi:7-cyano-7-deazaguanine synthase
VTVHAPLQHLKKSEIAQEAARRAEAGESWSCYDPLPDGRACGECDSCRLRKAGFAEAGLIDGTRYGA